MLTIKQETCGLNTGLSHVQVVFSEENAVSVFTLLSDVSQVLGKKSIFRMFLWPGSIYLSKLTVC